jgi:hypothetical protein
MHAIRWRDNPQTCVARAETRARGERVASAACLRAQRGCVRGCGRGQLLIRLYYIPHPNTLCLVSKCLRFRSRQHHPTVNGSIPATRRPRSWPRCSSPGCLSELKFRSISWPLDRAAAAGCGGVCGLRRAQRRDSRAGSCNTRETRSLTYRVSTANGIHLQCHTRPLYCALGLFTVRRHPTRLGSQRSTAPTYANRSPPRFLFLRHTF